MILAAKKLGCTPWELENQEKTWFNRALAALDCEGWAEKMSKPPGQR